MGRIEMVQRLWKAGYRLAEAKRIVDIVKPLTADEKKAIKAIKK